VIAHDPYVREADWERVLGNGCDVPLTANLDEALRLPLRLGSGQALRLALRLAQDTAQDRALAEADCVAIVTRHRDYAATDGDRDAQAGGGGWAESA